MLDDFSPIAINKNLLIPHTDLTNPVTKSCVKKDKMKNFANIFNSPIFIIFTNLFLVIWQI